MGCSLQLEEMFFIVSLLVVKKWLVTSVKRGDFFAKKGIAIVASLCYIIGIKEMHTWQMYF